MLKHFPLFLSLLPVAAGAQQFIGSNNSLTPAVRQVPLNPAWTAAASDGIEFHLFSVSGLAGTNAYRFSKSYVNNGFPGKGVEGHDYFKDQRYASKYVWGNVDMMGPAITFRVNQAASVGFYTRMRTIIRGGNVNNEAFQIIGNHSRAVLEEPVRFAGSGYTTHTFSEIGFSYGRVLGNDFYHVFRGGFNLKYVMGMAAGSIYTEEAMLVSGSVADSIRSLAGDLHVSYSNNINPYVSGEVANQPSAWFQKNGRGGIGLDLGFQYEYHPDGNPNNRTPYKYSLAVSITDIGSVRYTADTGSATYEMHVNNAAGWQYTPEPYQPYLNYFHRLIQDTLVTRTSEITSFSVGLPTAFRVNFDWHMGGPVHLQTNILLNLKGSGDGMYNPGYVSMFNITPRYQHRFFSVAMPFTYIGYQMLTVGAAVHIGPFYAGSSSLVSTMLAKQVNALDGYAGITIPLQKQRNRY